MLRLLRMEPSVEAMALLISRALGRAVPAGEETKSAYAAAASRINCTPTLPQSVWVRLLPVPSKDSTSAESIRRCSRISNVKNEYPECLKFLPRKAERLE